MFTPRVPRTLPIPRGHGLKQVPGSGEAPSHLFRVWRILALGPKAGQLHSMPGTACKGHSLRLAPFSAHHAPILSNGDRSGNYPLPHASAELHWNGEAGVQRWSADGQVAYVTFDVLHSQCPGWRNAIRPEFTFVERTETIPGLEGPERFWRSTSWWNGAGFSSFLVPDRGVRTCTAFRGRARDQSQRH